MKENFQTASNGAQNCKVGDKKTSGVGSESLTSAILGMIMALSTALAVPLVSPVLSSAEASLKRNVKSKRL